MPCNNTEMQGGNVASPTTALLDGVASNNPQPIPIPSVAGRAVEGRRPLPMSDEEKRQQVASYLEEALRIINEPDTASDDLQRVRSSPS